jgi:uncharacterized protein YkwD
MKLKILQFVMLTFLSSSVFSKIPSNVITDTVAASEYLLKIINDYRISKGVSALSSDTNYAKACGHHTKYMALYNVCSHSQVEYTKKEYHKNVPNIEDRFKLYTRSWGLGRYGENVTLISCSLKYENLEMKKWMNLWNASVASGSPNYVYAAHCVLWAWQDSPSHNRLLLDPDMKRAGAFFYEFTVAENGKMKIAGVFAATN